MSHSFINGDQGGERTRQCVQSQSAVALGVCRHLKQQGIREIYGRAFHTSVVKLRKADSSHAWQRISDLVLAGLLLRRAAADISCTGVKPHSCFPNKPPSVKRVYFTTTVELAGPFTCKGC